MTRKATLATLCLAFIASASAQAPTPAAVVKGAKDAVAYATYAEKPVYPLAARARHIEGSGVFLLHIRADGTVKSVEAFPGTGHPELDDAAITAFLKWRFRPGRPTKVKMPITFSLHGPHSGT